MAQTFGATVLLLFLVYDSPGNIPLFASALHGLSPARRLHVILRECAIALGVLWLTALTGARLLHLLGISQAGLGISGGIILFLIAVRMIFRSDNDIFGVPSGQEPVVFPLAVPYLAGPSALATVILLGSSKGPGLVTLLGAIAVAMTISAAVLLMAEPLSRRLGDRATQAITKLMGMVLTALAVEMFLRGLRQWNG
jgi:MarC family membrane protein